MTQRFLCMLACCLAFTTANAIVTPPITLHAGVYNNGDNTFTLRWATNDKTLSTGPRVVGLGSSTLAGYLLSYPDRLGDKISAWLENNTSNAVWINLAVAGYSSYNLLPATAGGNAGTNIDSAINSHPDFIFISLPTNDVANGLTNTQILANFRRLDTIALKNGIPVFWETTQPRTAFSATLQTQLKVLADSIRIIWPTRYVEGFNSLADANATTDASINTLYALSDNIHINSTGNQLIADSLFARWQQYFQAIDGVTAYIVETSADGNTWSSMDTITDAAIVKKTYAITSTQVQYFRVRALYTDGSWSDYSNIVTLPGTGTSTTTPVRNTNRILVDLGGDGVNTVLPNGTPMGLPTSSPDRNGNYWNNWYGSGGAAGFRDGAAISQLISTGDSTTTISLRIIGEPDGSYNASATTRGINANGFTVGVNDYPVTAIADNMFLHNSINPNGVILRIKGLIENKTYAFKLWGARLDNTTTPRILETRLGTQTWSAARSIDTRYAAADSPDYDRAITYTGVTGVDSLDIYLRVGTGSTFASLSLLDITYSNNKAVVTDTTTLCEGSGVTFISGVTAGSHQWQRDTGSGFENISGETGIYLQLSNALPAWSGYRFRCMADEDSTEVHYVIVDPLLTPVINIQGTTTVRQYTTTTLRSTVANGGTSPLYQWKDSTSSHTWTAVATSDTLSYTPRKTGDKLLCLLTSNAACISRGTVSSDTLSFTVNIITAVDPDPGTSIGMRLYPNPVSSTLTLDQLKASDLWKTLEIRSIDGKSSYVNINISNQTSIHLSVSNMANGLYLLVLKKANGTTAVMKFVKD